MRPPGGKAGDLDPALKDNEQPEEERTPVLWIAGSEGLHRFMLLGQEVTIGRDIMCDVSIGHREIEAIHVVVVPQRDVVRLSTMGMASVWISGERFRGECEHPYRAWWHFNKDIKAAVTRNTEEEPYDWPDGQPWHGD